MVGEASLSLFSFPAAATTTAPLVSASAIASLIAWSPPPAGPPRLRLMTPAPLFAAKAMPSAIPELLPPPSASSARMAMICACGATPATPMPLFATAAAVPATCEPWRLKSSGVVPGSTKSAPLMPPGPFHRFGARSGCVRSTPVSTMAITWPLPSERSQAGSTPTPGVEPNPHRWPKWVSFGAAASAW